MFAPMRPAPTVQLPARSDWILALAAIALLLLAVRPFWGLTVDDALISFRYAQNWVAGCGPVYNCGEAPVEGYTNFLWVVFATLALAVKAPLLPTMHTLGLLCAGAALLAAARLARDLFAAPAAALIAVLGLAASPFFALNSVVALETSAATLSVLVAVHLSLRLPERRPVGAGLAWAISYLIRPEALMFAFLTGLYALLRGLLGRRGLWPTLRGCLRYAAGFLAIALPYFLWRAIYYRSLFPNTYYAKKGALSQVVPHNLGLLWKHPVFWCALLGGALLAVLLRRRAGVLYTLLIALASAAISLSVHNNWWMPGHRLYMTAALLLAVLAGGLFSLGARSSFWLQRKAGPALALAVLAALWYSAWKQQTPTSKAAEQHYAREGHPAEKMGQRIKMLAKKGDWLLIRDAGFIPYFAGTKVKVLDMHDHSLNDRRIARRGWDLNYVLSHRARFVVLASYNPRILALVHPSESRLHAHPDFRGYREIMRVQWHGARHYFLFERQPKPPAPKPPLKPPLRPAGKPPAKVAPRVAPKIAPRLGPIHRRPLRRRPPLRRR